MRFPFCNAVLKLIRSVRGNASHFFQTNSAFFRRYLTRAKPDLSFVAEKKIEMSFSESVGDRGSEKIRSDKFFTFFLEPLFIFLNPAVASILLSMSGRKMNAPHT